MPTWLRCEDEHGNQFDLSPEDARVTGGVVKVLDDYPPNTGLTAVARADKPRSGKGQPQTPPATPPADSTPAGTSAKSRRSNSDG